MSSELTRRRRSSPAGWSVGWPEATVILLFLGAFLVLSSGTTRYWDELIYLYSVDLLTVPELIQLERGLSSWLVPSGFFSGKVGFLAMLDGAVAALGPGRRSLTYLNLACAALTLTWGASAFLLYRSLLDARTAFRSSAVLLLLPVTVYLGQRVLAEMPSLLPATLSCWCFVRGVDSERPTGAATPWLIGAGALLGTAMLIRISAMWLLASLIPALWVLSRDRFPLRRLALRGGAVLLGGALAGLSVYLALEADPIRLMGLVDSVAARDQGIELTVYAFGMTLQFFALPVCIGALKYSERDVLFALTWVATASAPYALGSSYLEPRYFFCALLPLALLATKGTGWLVDRVAGASRATLLWAPLTLALALGNSVFQPLMPYEIDTARYLDLLDEVEDRVGSATIVTSWHADYAFFEFMRPDESHVLTLAYPADSSTEFFRSPAMRRWLGDGRYAADLPELCDLSEPVVLVGWSYNPSVLNLAGFGRMLGLFEQDELVDRLGLRHHLSLSAFWPESRRFFDPLARVGDYRAYRFAVDRACAGSAR